MKMTSDQRLDNEYFEKLCKLYKSPCSIIIGKIFVCCGLLLTLNLNFPSGGAAYGIPNISSTKSIASAIKK